MNLMHIGIAKEIAAGGMEKRVILLPGEVKKLVEEGHRVYAERGLGERIHISDVEYRDVGAKICGRKEVFKKEIVVKLKPPLQKEFNLLKNNILFCMLHAEQNPRHVEALKMRGVKAVAMELVRNRAGERLIQCTDMAGEQGMIMAFHLAEKSPSGCNVLVLGYGTIASGALKVAFGLGAKAKILRKKEYPYIRHFLRNRDILVNGVRWPEGKRKRKEYLVTKDMLSLLNRGAIILDLSVDYPNAVETCRPSHLDRPVYTVNNIRHISIFGYPGLVPVSSAKRYSRQVLPVLLKIASFPFARLPAYIRRAVIDPEIFVS